MLAVLYKKLVPKEWRYWLYCRRHPEAINALRTRKNHHEKGEFSLAPFDEKRAIFIHITKTAGTSVALALFGALPYHYQGWQYRCIYGRETFDKYYKFAFVRNPWDRLYSAFSYLKGGGWDDKDAAWAKAHLEGVEDFNQFVTEWLTPERLRSHMHFWPQSDFICDSSNKALVNYLAYFESINSDFEYIADKIGCEKPLAHTNKSQRASYRDVYSPEAIERVAELYRQDIVNFGYTFDGYTRMKVVSGQFVHE